MVELLDPPIADTQSTPKKRGGGPRTLMGRMRARENAVGESLFSKVVFSRKMALSILDRNALLSLQHRPTSQYQVMLVADMALAKARLDRVAGLQVDNCDHSIDRITKFWAHDQHERALKYFARLPKDPPRMAHSLSGFKQGAELMIHEWEGLASVAASGIDWDEEQRRGPWISRGQPGPAAGEQQAAPARGRYGGAGGLGGAGDRAAPGEAGHLAR